MKTVDTYTFISELHWQASAPMHFLCNCEGEFEPYYIKYALEPKLFDTLVYELVCAELAPLLDLYVPEVALVNVMEGSFDPNSLTRNKNLFKPNVIAFGSKEVKPVVELSLLIGINSKFDARQYLDLESLVSIIIFDMWVDNRDRTESNFNLLRSEEKPNEFILIDHAACFAGEPNIGTFHPGLPVDINRTISRSQMFRSAFEHMDMISVTQKVNTFCYIWSEEAERIIQAIENAFENVPGSWTITKDLKERIQTFLLDTERNNTICEQINDYLDYLKDELEQELF